MTVADDLALREGVRRRYFLKIAGLPYVLNQRVADPTGDDSPLGGEVAGVAGLSGAQSHPLDADIIAGWRCNETATTDDLVDASGNGHTATKTKNSPSKPGLFGTSREFKYNASGVFACAVDTDFDPLAVTISAWFKLRPGEATAGGNVICGKDIYNSGQDYSYGLRLSGNDSDAMHLVGNVRVDNGTAYGDLQAPATADHLSTGVWHLATLTYDGANVILYLDGAVTDSHAETRAIWYNAALLFRFGRGLWEPPIDLDEAFVYASAKSAAWVADIYSGGVGGLNCLRVPGQEVSTALDLGTMKVEASSMTFELDDIEDPADG